MDRRTFLKSAALAVAGTALGTTGMPALGAADTASGPSATSPVRNAMAGMPYRPFGKTGVMVSPIGFGMMRLPMLPGGGIDEEQTQRMMRYGIDQGMNYVDTSYVYLGGKSEAATGRALLGGYRERAYLATKSPSWAIERVEDFDRILDEQLERLQSDVIDFYLIHNINFKTWEPRVKRFKMIDSIEKAKERGKIRHMGFSFHASLPVFKQVIDATPNWDFCQIQLNCLDTEYEAGLLGMKYASDRGLGVVVMEPLRGGFLADVPPEVAAMFAGAAQKRSPVEWAFDYLWNMPEVGVTLSGMSAMRHMMENIDSAKRSAIGMLTTDDKALLAGVVNQFRQYGTFPCTGCEYCHPCPQDVAIAQNMMIYNQYKIRGDAYIGRYHNLPGAYGLNANACNDCGECRCKCPVGFDVPAAVKTIRETFKA